MGPKYITAFCMCNNIYYFEVRHPRRVLQI